MLQFLATTTWQFFLFFARARMTHSGTHTLTRSVSEGERSVDVIRQTVP